MEVFNIKVDKAQYLWALFMLKSLFHGFNSNSHSLSESRASAP